MKYLLALLPFPLLLSAPLAAQQADPPTPASVIADAPASDWAAIDPADMLVMTLAPDAQGEPRQVVVQLMPPPFSQGWVGNIRKLAAAQWWDGTSVYRVVDNWVSQWGDVDETKLLPGGLQVIPESAYGTEVTHSMRDLALGRMARVPFPDPQAPAVFFQNGWPTAASSADYPLVSGGSKDAAFAQAWPIHCYGSVGVARNLSPDTGTGAELYAVIGHAPRALDRNIAVVGRVIEGIEHLSTLPRGKGDAGVYDDPALRVPIVSVRLGNALPAADQPRFEYLASQSASFAAYLAVRANRNDSFYRVPAGGVDICNVPVPIRRSAAR
jgi:peptidylprolyl isomerase